MRKVYKNLFDFNTTTMRSDAEEFQVRRISEELAARIEIIYNQLSAVEEKATMSCFFSIVKIILNLIWGCIFVGMIRSSRDGTSWKQMYEAIPGMFYLGTGGVITMAFSVCVGNL